MLGFVFVFTSANHVVETFTGDIEYTPPRPPRTTAHVRTPFETMHIAGFGPPGADQPDGAIMLKMRSAPETYLDLWWAAG